MLYHSSSKVLYRIKAYRTGYLNISLVFQEIEFPSLPRSLGLKVHTVPNQFGFHILGFFFLEVKVSKAKNSCWIFLNSIAFKHMEIA